MWIVTKAVLRSATSTLHDTRDLLVTDVQPEEVPVQLCPGSDIQQG